MEKIQHKIVVKSCLKLGGVLVALLPRGTQMSRILQILHPEMQLAVPKGGGCMKCTLACQPWQLYDEFQTLIEDKSVAAMKRKVSSSLIAVTPAASAMVNREEVARVENEVDGL
ncbi:hypothetical protein O6H91_03G098400 [Diphasiastrum complanatum]|uniref:Uncharacterized protein n=1 Tax=Diphasiastrum complanatum TaxID=34168 RepID=A0ACC2E9H8_DIPCM|nr:hypothetical protein O6H91_03G098400 [Diphasiastrum complanatum]